MESFAELRSREYARLDTTGQVYLDYTGAGLSGESQVRRHAALLRRSVLGNPHSESPASSASTIRIEETRRRVLSFFKADPAEYTVIFAANATAAVKLVAEAYPFDASSRFVRIADNHNSINGIREFARARGAASVVVPLDAELRVANLAQHLTPVSAGNSLFAYPAQSNFTGVKHPLEWVEVARAAGYDVLLDAAAYVPTNPLDLSAVRPDYTVLSFYKMFGYPTGVGALIVRKEALEKLRRPWFAGGTVQFVSSQNDLHLLKNGAEAFEDGTPDFNAIMAIPFGLDVLEEVGMERIREHVLDLTRSMLAELTALRHASGAPLARILGPIGTEMRGATVSFLLLDANGREVDCDTIAHAASAANISLRTGCFCNPGAAEHAFSYDSARSRHCLETIPSAEFSLQRFSDCMGGVPVGAVRASLGIASNAADVAALIELMNGFTG